MSDPLTRRCGRRRGLAVVLVALLATMTACGVPSGGPPVADSIPTSASIVGGGAPPVPNPGSFETDAGTFVHSGYLSAVAGQVTARGQIEAASKFMETDPTWHSKTTPGSANPAPVTVVRVINTHAEAPANGETTVTEDVQIVGSFDPAEGGISPAAATAKPIRLRFTVSLNRSTPIPQWQIDSAPNGFYLSDVAFRNYIPQNVYFWDTNDNSPRLIPDLRYLPNWMSASRRATVIVKWILAGPPAWMGAAAAQQKFQNVGLAFPTVDYSDGKFTVDVNTMSAKQQADFVAEVQWSLFQEPSEQSGFLAVGPVLPNVGLQIGNLNVPVSPTAVDVGLVQDPIAYAIDGGVVRPYGDGNSNGSVNPFGESGGVSSDITRTLDSPQNKNVVLAAIQDTSEANPPPAANTLPEVNAALVTTARDGSEELWISRTKSGSRPKFTRIKSATTFARPQWLPGGGGVLAFVADGKFYVNVPGASSPSQVTVPGLTAGITTFSVGPDGHQLALVSGGMVWVGLLTVGPTNMITQPRAINLAPELTAITAVGWSDTTSLVVGGTHDGIAVVVETLTDGTYGIDGKSPELASNGYAGAISIGQLSSYPFSPLRTGARSSSMMVQTGESGAFSGRGGPLAMIWSSKKPATNPFFENY